MIYPLQTMLVMRRRRLVSTWWYVVMMVLMRMVASAAAALDVVLYEDQRLEEYHRRNYTWPPLSEEFRPANPNWEKLMRRRMSQVDRLTDAENCWNGYMSIVHCALMCPAYTDHGWGLSRAPPHLWNQVHDYFTNHFDRTTNSNMPYETYEDAIHTLDNDKYRPWFVELPRPLLKEVLWGLLPLMEAWTTTGGSGRPMSLIPHSAYGLRVYQNTSRLHMHTDQRGTHVISAIFHIAHDQDSEPWPLVIEDYQGTTNEVVLEAGDVLLYESSKCLHGRPRPFQGHWYTSLFVHYYPAPHQNVSSSRPVHDADQNYHPDEEGEKNGGVGYWDWLDLETRYRVPPHFRTRFESMTDTTVEDLDDYEIIDTYMREPKCLPDEWCALLLQDEEEGDNEGKSQNYTVLHRVYGPGPEFGRILSANNIITDVSSTIFQNENKRNEGEL